MKRDGLLVLAPHALAFGEPGFCRGDDVAGGGELGVEGLFALGLLGEPALRVLSRRVEALQHDQMFEVSIHKQKKPRRLRTGASWNWNLSVPILQSCNSEILQFMFASWWAHQDSNLEQAGYEPAALTVELWARSRVYQ